MSNTFSLSQLGWSAFFQQQLNLQQWQQWIPARVMAVHRSHIEIACEQQLIPNQIAVSQSLENVTVGDWLMLDEQGIVQCLLDPFSVFSRKAAGSKLERQLIAANVNTLFIVCSLDHNFNLNRIERYLALANEAEVEPVLVLTKADCCDDVLSYVEQITKLDPMLMVEALNALHPDSVSRLLPWCGVGKTIAVLGSSGVGKSTLINSLLGNLTQPTGAAREQDSRGRHTTTSRSLHVMNAGGLLLDTPGMRELQLADCATGVAVTFADIEALSRDCRFSDCQHQQEPHCAVRMAIAQGELEARRLTNYQKLQAEQQRNTATLADKRQQERQLHKYYRNVQSQTARFKKGQ